MLFPRVFESVSEVLAALRVYLEDQLGVLRARLSLELARTTTYIITTLLLLIGGAFFLLLLTVAFGIWMSGVLESYILGSLSAAGLWLVLMVVLLLLRRELFTNPLVRRLYRTESKSKRTGNGEDEAPIRTLGALKAHEQRLKEQVGVEEDFITERLRSIPSEASEDMSDQMLHLLVRISATRLLNWMRRPRRSRAKR